MARHESPNHDSPATAQHHSTKPPLPPSGCEPTGKRQTVRVAKPTTKSHTAPNPRGQARTDKAPASAEQRTPLDGGHNVEVEQEEKSHLVPLLAAQGVLLGETKASPKK